MVLKQVFHWLLLCQASIEKWGLLPDHHALDFKFDECRIASGGCFDVNPAVQKSTPVGFGLTRRSCLKFRSDVVCHSEFRGHVFH